jgi:hypothetical protein
VQSVLHVRFVLRKLFCIFIFYIAVVTALSYIAVVTAMEVRANCLMVAGVYRNRRILKTKAVWKEHNFNSSLENYTVFMQSFRFVASYTTGEEFCKETLLGRITLLYACWGAEPGPHCPVPIPGSVVAAVVLWHCSLSHTLALFMSFFPYGEPYMPLCCPSTHFIFESK